MSERRFDKLRYIAQHFIWVVRHPLNRNRVLATLWRYFGWHLGSRMVGRHAVAVPYVNDLRMLVATGGNAVGTVHFGLDEYSEQAFCAHLLRPGDMFVDVGASDGSYALMASGVAGADTIAFEPEPATVRCLMDNLVLNRLEARVQLRRCALGAEPGVVRITTNLRTGNHVVSGERPGDGEAVEVRCSTLDVELAGIDPVMLKIDVEGFEPLVLAGAGQLLARPSLLAVLLEDMNRGHEVSAQHRLMLDLGFRSAVYVPEKRRLRDLDGRPNQGELNTIYVRNVERVAERLASAPKFHIRGHDL